MSVDTLLDRLDGARPNGKGKWVARCPAHGDRSPSLSIREADDGIILVHCFAQCPATDVVAAVGLELRDLFPEPIAHHRPAQRRQRIPAGKVLDAVSQALTVIALADRKVCDFLPLDDDEREAVDRALAVLAEAWRQAA